MEFRLATHPSPGCRNEDAAIVGEDFAVVLDGATAEPDTDSGCHHGVRWFATELAGRLGRLLASEASRDASLSMVLHDTCGELASSHADTCDLTNNCTPTATVALVRAAPGRIDYLVLGDATVAIRTKSGDVRVITDDRILRFDDLPWAQLRHHRNVPGGFWVASSRPEAALHAVAGQVPTAEVDCVALFSDGAARLVERYGWEWPQLIDALVSEGPAAVIALTRAAERDTPPGRFPGKHHDDATAVLCR